MLNCPAVNSSQMLHRDDELRVATTMSLVIGSFLISWMPISFFFIFIVIYGNTSIEVESNARRHLRMAAIMMTHFNSAIDVFIYAYRMKEVRDALKSLFRFSRPNVNSEVTSS